ncbi:glycosyl hydrolase family 18 protein [Pseudoalteromonas sp. OOF1S-7]|uniref:glycosyl hydrolase family 18 protein n=1 Tax=Pseudoalteromonas sp. OOF1S-7 TaxID=2917757 RepID=UPI001EF6A515|nr:glycosyl hydrolase family 18 protein [Pseudoalteromonas sp. OOF1S-7]MCG7535995.1 glycosyl hydrolase family 18 protein [Pseudoalteromonas sp. OOF1S-7]
MTFRHNTCLTETDKKHGSCEKAIYISGVQVRPAGLDGARLVAVGGIAAFAAHLDATRTSYPDTRLLLSLSPDDNGWRYLSQDINGCQVFCQSVVDFLRQYKLDGLNLDAAFYYAQLETQAVSGSAHFQNLATISPHDFDALLMGLKYQFSQATQQTGHSYLLTQIANSTGPLLNHSYPADLAPNSHITGKMHTRPSADRGIDLNDKKAAALRGGSGHYGVNGVVKYDERPLNSTQERDYFRYSRFTDQKLFD